MNSRMLTFSLCLTFAGAAMAAQANTSYKNQPRERAYVAPKQVPIGEPGSGAPITQTVEMNIIETESGQMLFEPDAIHIEKGSVVRFVIKNSGALEHEFFLGSFEEIAEHQKRMRDHPDTPHSGTNTVVILSGETAELDWKFSSKTNMEFVCLIPGHREAGMWGVIIVHDHLAPKLKD